MSEGRKYLLSLFQHVFIFFGSFFIGIGLVTFSATYPVSFVTDWSRLNPIIVALISALFIELGVYMIYKSEEKNPVIKAIVGSVLGLLAGGVAWFVYFFSFL